MIIVIISKSGQGKTYVEYEAGKNASYGLVTRWAGCKSERHGICLGSYMKLRSVYT